MQLQSYHPNQRYGTCELYNIERLALLNSFTYSMILIRLISTFKKKTTPSRDMCEKNITNRRTPLRNSNFANKPFRSPLTTIVTPNSTGGPENAIRQFPSLKGTPKRATSNLRHPIKRRRIDDAPHDDTIEDDPVTPSGANDPVVLKRRIHTKRQELDNLKTKLNYIKKHKTEDLIEQINKWRTACKEALFQFHKGIGERNSQNMTMQQILDMLGISNETVKFTEDECDMT